jgi:F-type H+-transporting ATPase subunit b
MMTWLTGLVAVAEEEEHIDQSHHWLWPEGYEIWFFGAAWILVFGLLFWKVGPFAKKALAARTDRVQQELDAAAEAKASAESEAARIRQAKGDIGAERSRLLAEADTQAQALLIDGRARLDREIAELHTKADADIASALGRVTDELRSEIARLASDTADRVVESALDDATQQRLVENYIARVGASV